MALLNLYKEKGSGSTGYATIKGLLKISVLLDTVEVDS